MTTGILALIRAGALGRAWAEFTRQGMDRVDDEPAVLTLHGRLLKEHARASDGDDQRRGFLASAEMYAKAAELERATYPLINAASLSLLGGDERRARVLAELTLARLDDPGVEPDTPYYVCATRAEAHLLLGQVDTARSLLQEALAIAPKAYEDHATTFRQFALLLSHMNEDAVWLNNLRPPVSLHFAGHMSIAPDDDETRDMILQRVGAVGACFGYGALAAGADILIAETILARGGQLTAVLPGSIAQFRAASVSGRGETWEARFDTLIEAADRVVEIPYADEAEHMLAVTLAGDIAMGMAAHNAARIESQASQLLVIRDGGLSQPGLSALFGRVWQQSGRSQERLVIKSRDAGQPLPPENLETGPLLAATVQMDLGSDRTLSELLLDPRLADGLAALPAPVSPPGWQGSILAFAYADPKDAVTSSQIVAGLVSDEEVRAAFDFGIGRYVREPFADGHILTGAPSLGAAHILDTVPLGARYASGSFFYALLARDAETGGELMGELELPEGRSVELYALRQ